MTVTDPLFDDVRRILADQDADHRLAWHDDPAGFARECIAWPEGKALTSYQAEILAALATDHRVAVRSLHGVGKTATAALSVLWFAVTRDAARIDWKCLTTAGGWHQLERYLWPEIAKWARRLRWDVIGRKPFDTRNELTALTLKLNHGQAFAKASDDPALLEGAHADSVLVVLDESKSIIPGVFDAVEGALSGADAFVLATSTPGAPVGRFYEIHQRRAGLTRWRPIHVSLSDALDAGQVKDQWVKDMGDLWGPESAIYANRVLGNFAADDEEGVIPLSWLEAAAERWTALREGEREPIGPPVVGIDVGGGGDKSVIARRRGDFVEFLERHNTPDTMALVGYAFPYSHEPGALTVIDAIGIGSGAASRLREQGCSVDPFNASTRSTQKTRDGSYGFLNRRAAAWWHLRELLDPAFGPTLALPDDAELIGDLSAPRWAPNSAGRIQIEAKSEVRKRLGRSPDAGDAVVMACCGLSTSWARTDRPDTPVETVHKYADAQDWSHLGVTVGAGGMDWSPPTRSYPADHYFTGPGS